MNFIAYGGFSYNLLNFLGGGSVKDLESLMFLSVLH